MFRQLFCVSLFLSIVFADHYFFFENRCPFPVWPGIAQNYRNQLLDNGGFKMNATSKYGVDVPLPSWAGKVWGRTNCNEVGHCETGDCGGKIHCNGSGPTGPVTVAQFGLDGLEDLDYYEVSLENGYNLPMEVKPNSWFNKTTHDPYDCGMAGCIHDLNEHCPDELKVLNAAKHVIACKSSCQAHSTDEHCCRGEFAEPERCKPNNATQSTVFKSSCPNVRSHQFDASSRTFWCKRKELSMSFDIIFCPQFNHTVIAE